MPISRKLGSGKLLVTVSFKGFEWAPSWAFSTTAVFFAGTVFEAMVYVKICFRWRMPMLRCAGKSVFFIASTKLASNAQITYDIAFNAAAPVETCSRNGGKENERTKKPQGREGKGNGRKIELKTRISETEI